MVVEALNRDSIKPAMTKLSLSDVHTHSHDEVYYQEVDDTPGLCVEHSDGLSSWSPIKLNQKAVKPASAESSDCDLDVSECLCLDVQLHENVPGVEIETHDESFWVPVSHRTRSRLKSST
ncbi:MAG: hypothetical protein MJE68_31215 [Proteobacteria bacterium]|nr:hypothetical protein [Pseudomonadota bacterium]